MKAKVSEAVGPVLDWMVAKCESEYGLDDADRFLRDHRIGFTTRYSTTWSQGGPIIEREMRDHGFDVWRTESMTECAASYTRGVPSEYVFGPTPLIAAMRCFVVSRLGNEIEVPEELLK